MTATSGKMALMVRSVCVLVFLLFLASCLPKAEELQAPIVQHYRYGDQGLNLRQVGIAFLGEAASTTIVDHDNLAVEYDRISPDLGAVSNVRNVLSSTDVGRRFTRPPTVHVGDHGPVMRDLVLKSIQILNTALPNDFQIRLDPDPYISSRLAPAPGTIRIEMASNDTWSRPWVGPYPPDKAGMAVSGEQWSQVFLDTATMRGSSEESRLRIITHELTHSLGVDTHYDQADEDHTLMVPTMVGNPENAPLILFWNDFLVLRGLYDPESLSDWGRERYQVQGCMDDAICFGATGVMGDVEPWANGWTPSRDLADNPVLIGNATWRGRLIGLTPYNRVVGGAAALTVNLDHLAGVLGFTQMESWSAGVTPGSVGSGSRWGDGDLHYGVQVRGNSFTQVDDLGDEGLVTGIFAGRSHEYMTGVLERDDLTAGFGGKR